MFFADFRLRLSGLIILTSLVPMPARAAFIYDEAVNGELSSDNANPTALGAAMVGSNTVTGRVTSIGNTGDNGTADIFSFVIPTGLQLNSIVLNSYSTSANSANMFLSMDNGPTYEFSPQEINDQINLPDMSLVMGASLVGTNLGVSVGDDVLDDLALSPILFLGPRFATPVPAGAYSIYIQETANFSNYSFSFNVTAVPEPGALTLLGLLPAVGLVHRRTLVHRRKSVPAE